MGFSLLTCLMSSIPLRARHRHVEQQHVEVRFAHELQRLVAVARLAHHLKIGRRGEKLLQPLAHDRVVVGDDDADHGGRSRRRQRKPHLDVRALARARSRS